jgi:hypothetical protein
MQKFYSQQRPQAYIVVIPNLYVSVIAAGSSAHLEYVSASHMQSTSNLAYVYSASW